MLLSEEGSWFGISLDADPVCGDVHAVVVCCGWCMEAFILGFLQPGFSRLPDHTPSVMWMGWRSGFCKAACFLQLPHGRLF
jgi:hypothetical protein